MGKLMRKSKKKIFIIRRIFVLASLCIIIFIPSFILVKHINKPKTSVDKPVTSLPSKSNLDSNKITQKALAEVTISSVGDCTIGHDSKFVFENSLPYQLKKHNYDYGYFFRNTVDIFKNDDLTIANLETTFTNSKDKADKQFTFKSPPEYVKALSLGSIEAVNISNNHIYDYLEKGFADTKDTLKNENINFFGEGNIWTTELKGVKFGFLGYRGFSYDNNFLTKLKNDIAALKSKGCIVVINFHWGDESQYYPNEVQKYLAHFSIDNNADLIIGHHPHVIEGIEIYKGKTICYSLANFCFGGNTYPSDKDSFILQSRFKVEDGKLKSYGIKVIPCSISSLKNINDYCPTPMEGDEKNNFFIKLNKLSPKAGFKITDEFTYFNL